MATKKQPEQPARILYTKIKISKGRVSIDYTEKVGEYFNELSMNMSQAPKKSFIDAMDSLAGDVLDICGINNKKEKLSERVQVHTVNIKYETEKEIPGVIISFKIKLPNRNDSININTPYSLLEARSENDLNVLDDDIKEKIFYLLEEADKYRSGQRENYEFKFQSEPEATEEPAAEPEKIKDQKAEMSNSIIAGDGKIFELGAEDYIVKTPEELKGVIKPGTLQQLTQLVNIKGLLNVNGKKGIYHLNPNEKGKTEGFEGQHKNGFSFKRNGNVMILDAVMEKGVTEYEPGDLNVYILDLLKHRFLNRLKITLAN